MSYNFYPNSNAYQNPYYNPNDIQFNQFSYDTGSSSQPFNNKFAPDMFTPGPPPVHFDDTDYENEPPLLEASVLMPFREISHDVLNDTDLAGPLVFCLIFGCTLLLAGKVHFNYIYGLAIFGCVGIYLLLKLMSLNNVTSVYVISTLGYCLLPLCILSSIGILLSLNGLIGIGLAVIVVLWCSISASKLFVCALDMHHQRVLVAYPCALVYTVFALLAVF